ncbi:MAG TPA: hypothetical protein VEZ12_11550, partial [Herpetosiphonaceae bacterium]|nr:hypothetical protein [Herpetosiphonaceae bacterium]
DLLDVGEQLLLGRMAVFAGGWTLDAAEQVSMTVGPLTMSMLDGLHVLLDKHLVQRTTGSDGEPRFMMLETIREYALERLTERGESAATQHAHAAYFRDLAERAASLLHGPEQIAWLDRLDEEHANVHVALAWLLDTGDLAGVLRLATSLSWFWYVRGQFGEGHAWLSRVLQEIAREPDLLASQLPNHTGLVARARLATSDFVLKRGELGAARDQFVVLLEDLRRLDDILGGDAEVRELMARTIISLLQAEGMLANHPDQLLIDEVIALAHTINDPQIVALHALNYGRGLLYGLGRPDLARPWLQQAEPLFQHLGDIYRLAMLTADLGMLAMFAGDLADAQRRFAEASAKAVALRDRFLEAEASNNLGEVARLVDDDDAAERHYQASLKLHHDLGTQVEAQRLIHNLGYLALRRGDRTLARARFAKSLTGFRAVGQVHGQVDAVAGLACVAASAGNVEQARRAACLWGAADADHGTLRTTRWPADQAERTRYEPLARALLGDAEYEAAYLAGAALSLDEAVAEAWHV